MTSSWQGFTIALNMVFDSGIKNLVSSRTLAQLLREALSFLLGLNPVGESIHSSSLLPVVIKST